MAGLAFTGTLPKFLPCAPAAVSARNWRRGFTVAAANPRTPQESDGRKSVKGEVKKAVEGLREMATSAGDQVVTNAQDLGEKAKQVASDAWGSAKETAEKVMDTVSGTAEDAKEGAKDNVESVKRAMNNKNC